MEESTTPWPPKAYKNLDFLNSAAARKIRVLCELTEPELRFREENIRDTIVMFGSARLKHPDDAKRELDLVEAAAAANPSEDFSEKLRLARIMVRSSKYYLATMQLAEELTKWSIGLKDKQKRFIVCSGGGPGIMEAANRGAKNVGGASIGLGISLPFEQGINKYVTHDLQFEFHYFFVRKYWFVYLAKALIVFPGGFGTMDELFETLTLIQTHKISKKMPIVLFGSEFWNSILNFDSFVEWGVISPTDLSLFKIIDSVDEARDYIIEFLTREYLS
ncbi:MAG: LOG family protein [Verrucomicrobia bacterium]|nr:LOG family protein [Verrucomicrobiota bacterium]